MIFLHSCHIFQRDSIGDYLAIIIVTKDKVLAKFRNPADVANKISKPANIQSIKKTQTIPRTTNRLRIMKLDSQSIPLRGSNFSIYPQLKNKATSTESSSE